MALSRIGLFGGTFDPVHIGHLILCQEAHYQLGLDRILLLPAADPPHKRDRQVTPVSHRIEMLSLAIKDVAYLSINRVDVDRPGPHYSVDTVQILQAELGDQADLYFLMGMDSLRNLPTWHRPEWLAAHCNLVTFQRAGVELDWASLERSLPGIHRKVSILAMPELEISSRDIRRRIQEGRPIRYMVPESVAEYIRTKGIY